MIIGAVLLILPRAEETKYYRKGFLAVLQAFMTL